MSERTPPTVTIRNAFARARPFPNTTDVDERYAEFDRWLTEYTRIKQAEAWDACREALYNRSYDDIQDQWLESISPYRNGESDE